MATVEQGCLFVNDPPQEKAGRPAGASASACAAGAPAGGEAALGNLTKSTGHFRDVIDEKTGEIQRFSLDSKRREWVAVSAHTEADELREVRAARFALHRAARYALRGQQTPRAKDWRVVSCAWRRTAGQVSVYKTRDASRAHFKGLMLCGSVWTCPACAAKISEHRKAEVLAAAETVRAQGGAVMMLTLTFAHTRNDDVAKLVKCLREALGKLRDHRAYKGLLRYVGFRGLIRALEVTHSDANGWHPHIHELWFLKGAGLTDAQLRVVRRELFNVWEVACVKAGLGKPNRKHGIRFEPAQVANYVAKWGIESELTKAHIKRGRGGSATPFDLLRGFAEGDERAGALFRSFATAFYGARQLFWSRGLKAELAVPDVDDQSIVESDDAESDLVGQISAQEWRAVLRQPYEARAVVLDLAERGGREAMREYVRGLLSRSAIP